MCSHLCADGVECLLSHDPMRFQTIRRGVFVPYLAAVTLYYIFMAVPIAGSIFGTWLAVSLNIFKSQCDLAFSSLQIQHYKNFVKLHIKDDGELEIFAIGLRKVPTKWVKDHKFDDCNSRKKRKEVERKKSSKKTPPSFPPPSTFCSLLPSVNGSFIPLLCEGTLAEWSRTPLKLSKPG